MRNSLYIPSATVIFSQNFQKMSEFLKTIRNFKNYARIWNQHGKCIKMSTNKPMFGPAVLEITFGILTIFKNEVPSLLQSLWLM